MRTPRSEPAPDARMRVGRGLFVVDRGPKRMQTGVAAIEFGTRLATSAATPGFATLRPCGFREPVSVTECLGLRSSAATLRSLLPSGRGAARRPRGSRTSSRGLSECREPVDQSSGSASADRLMRRVDRHAPPSPRLGELPDLGRGLRHDGRCVGWSVGHRCGVRESGNRFSDERRRRREVPRRAGL